MQHDVTLPVVDKCPHLYGYRIHVDELPAVAQVHDVTSIVVDVVVFIFQGTNIAAGKARGVVVGTGLNTEIGKYRYSVQHQYRTLSTTPVSTCSLCVV